MCASQRRADGLGTRTRWGLNRHVTHKRSGKAQELGCVRACSFTWNFCVRCHAREHTCEPMQVWAVDTFALVCMFVRLHIGIHVKIRNVTGPGRECLLTLECTCVMSLRMYHDVIVCVCVCVCVWDRDFGCVHVFVLVFMCVNMHEGIKYTWPHWPLCKIPADQKQNINIRTTWRTLSLIWCICGTTLQEATLFVISLQNCWSVTEACRRMPTPLLRTRHPWGTCECTSDVHTCFWLSAHRCFRHVYCCGSCYAYTQRYSATSHSEVRKPANTYIHVCIYTYIRTYVYVYVYSHVCMYVCICSDWNIYTYICTYVYVYVYSHVCMIVCVCSEWNIICTYVCLCVRMYAWPV